MEEDIRDLLWSIEEWPVGAAEGEVVVSSGRTEGIRAIWDRMQDQHPTSYLVLRNMDEVEASRAPLR